MTPARLVALAVAATAALVATPAAAGQRHHHRSHHAPSSRGHEEAYPQAYGGHWQAEAIARAAREMQDAPGVTNELAPDAKATATGGPSGGVPGFSAH